MLTSLCVGSLDEKSGAAVGLIIGACSWPSRDSQVHDQRQREVAYVGCPKSPRLGYSRIGRQLGVRAVWTAAAKDNRRYDNGSPWRWAEFGAGVLGGECMSAGNWSPLTPSKWDGSVNPGPGLLRLPSNSPSAKARHSSRLIPLEADLVSANTIRSSGPV